MESLNKHVSGAEALLQLRGKHQLETVRGRDLFAHIRAQIVSSCVSALKFERELILLADNKVLADTYRCSS
jgi:hypothetical protein